ncbi:unannotated protein [freshwater metagenome]|uniref:Unannotated protein n=1 Tax=freshwater metagenome TaxID=449393 RepID=A0A6J6YVX9_9ZZZZ
MNAEAGGVATSTSVTSGSSIGKGWELCRYFASDRELSIELGLGCGIKRVVADRMVVTISKKGETLVVDIGNTC